MPKNNMPSNWTPPAPAWQSVWQETDDPLITGYFGIQGDEPISLEKWAKTAFFSEHAPLHLEQGKYIDQENITNHLFVAYWRNSAYQQWWAKNAAWWMNDKRLEEGVGYWREIIAMPFDHFETLHSTATPHGIGTFADDIEGPIDEHGYPGGARDRIPLSETSDLKNIKSVQIPLKAQQKAGGKRVTITPPENMCVIQSGQDWSNCSIEEKAFYLDNVHPTLLEGMRFLRDNPIDANCYALRFVDKKDSNWETKEQSFGLGYAPDIYAFENWAKSHPTHLAIFGDFMKMVSVFGEEMKLQLWHEVAVLPSEGSEFEYINCHANTGLLGYADSSKME